VFYHVMAARRCAVLHRGSGGVVNGRPADGHTIGHTGTIVTRKRNAYALWGCVAGRNCCVTEQCGTQDDERDQTLHCDEVNTADARLWNHK